MRARARGVLCGVRWSALHLADPPIEQSIDRGRFGQLSQTQDIHAGRVMRGGRGLHLSCEAPGECL
jgi:hypothetical protein